MHHRQQLHDERGSAMPLALILLMILSGLTATWATLAQTEPVIANNHRLASMARALAESGLERAAWGLAHPTTPGGLAVPAPAAVAGPPYDGATFVRLNGLGGFTVKLTGVTANAVDVDAVGWTPEAAPGQSHRRILATLMRIKNLWLDAPCTLCVRGDIIVSGDAEIDGRPSMGSACGNKVGTYSTGSLVLTNKAAAIYGADGNNGRNQPSDYQDNQPQDDFDAFTLSAADLGALRGLARWNGTYYQGSRTFNSANPIPKDGIVFVDTPSGTTLGPTTPLADVPTVTIRGGAVATPPFRGWIIVNGNLEIAGDFEDIKGIVYVVGQAATTGFGTAELHGLMIVQQALGGAGFPTGNTEIEFDCDAATGGPYVPETWFVQAGSYKEVAD